MVVSYSQGGNLHFERWRSVLEDARMLHKRYVYSEYLRLFHNDVTTRRATHAYCVFIQGSTIKYLRIPDEVIDMVKEEVVSKGKDRV